MLGFIILLLLPAAWAKHVCKPVILSNNDKDCECESRRYIVTFRDDVRWSKRQEIVNSLPRKAHYVYNEVIKGFSATLENKDLAKLYDYDEYVRAVIFCSAPLSYPYKSRRRLAKTGPFL